MYVVITQCHATLSWSNVMTFEHSVMPVWACIIPPPIFPKTKKVSENAIPLSLTRLTIFPQDSCAKGRFYAGKNNTGKKISQSTREPNCCRLWRYPMFLSLLYVVIVCFPTGDKLSWHCVATPYPDSVWLEPILSMSSLLSLSLIQSIQCFVGTVHLKSGIRKHTISNLPREPSTPHATSTNASTDASTKCRVNLRLGLVKNKGWVLKMNHRKKETDCLATHCYHSSVASYKGRSW